ncbi:MAG: deoxynucleoside kinase [Deltaproteobacteria bacterium]|nr:MAG: deoxynucleoside kinase [Deltaproteobacteria bacterium]
MRPRYIVVEGPIGVGKTTLVRALARRFGARSVFEVVEENPFLADFYTDRDLYAFQTQIFFLLSRFRQQEELAQADLFQQVVVSDYLFAKDRIFAELTLKGAELGLYHRVYDALSPRVPRPDLVIYLQARLEVLLERIRERGRPFERDFDARYLADLCEIYNDFFFRYDETPLLVVNTSDVDFRAGDVALDDLIDQIHALRGGTKHYVPRMPTRAELE